VASDPNAGESPRVRARDIVVVDQPTGQLEYLIVALVKLAGHPGTEYGIGYNEGRDDIIVVDPAGKIVDEQTAKAVLEPFDHAIFED
jgi:hypothetical protein